MLKHIGTTVEHALEQVAHAWAAGDSTTYANQFTEDADYTAFDGTRMAGREAIDAGHRALFAGTMRGSTMTFETPNIRYLRDDVAIVTVRGGIIMRWQNGRTSPSPKRVSALTFVLVRDEDTWLVSAFQNTRYRPWDKTLLGRLMSRAGSK